MLNSKFVTLKIVNIYKYVENIKLKAFDNKDIQLQFEQPFTC